METESGTLLVVDDNELNRDMLSRRLQRRGHQVVTAEDGAIAFELIESTEGGFDVVLLDVMMPGIDGPTTLGKLREIPELAKTPVIFVTAKAMPAEIERYKALGAIGVILKPFDPTTISEGPNIDAFELLNCR